ncbi:MAG: hypothetical protein IT245_05595 [Bacteroidia bacterium]|nr:hypothetical protein [Bacteroidia bacterium]
MRKTDYFNSKALGWIIRVGLTKRAGILCLLTLVIMNHGIAQSHDHEDTLVALPKNAFSINLLQNTGTQFKFEIVNNNLDTIEPFFVEIFAIGFNFTEECILQQSINNNNLETNLEKLWGPQFISLGVGTIPPSGHYATTLGTLSNSQGSMIKIRVFGTINGQNVIWVGYLKK